MSQVWREVSRHSMRHKIHGTTGSLVKALADVTDSRVYRSSSGSEAVVLSKRAVTDSPELVIELDSRGGEYHFVAVLPQVDQSEDIGGLRKYCDVIALPEEALDMAPQGMVSCGRLIYRGAPDDSAAFSLFRNQPASSELLTRDAPRDIGEPDDNLDSREDWFKKRHSNKK